MTLALVASLLLGQAAPARPPASLTRLVVAPFHSDDSAAALAASVTDGVVARLSARADIEVVTEAEVARLMQQEEQHQLAGCASDTCLADLARIVDADETVSGSVTVVGDRYSVSIVRLESATGAVRRRVQREARSDEELIDAVAEAVDALWDEVLPASRCVECVALERRGLLGIKLGNNFATFFQHGLDVNVLTPGFDLELAYHFWTKLSLTFSAGMSFGKSSTASNDNVHFQVVPLTLGARYDMWRPNEALLIYLGGSLGVGFVRTALTDQHALTSSFSGQADSGVIYAITRRFRLLGELGYTITTNTPQAVRSAPFSALVINLGAGFVF